MILGQVMTIFKVNPDPDPDPHFGFLCEHGARCEPFKADIHKWPTSIQHWQNLLVHKLFNTLSSVLVLLQQIIRCCSTCFSEVFSPQRLVLLHSFKRVNRCRGIGTFQTAGTGLN